MSVMRPVILAAIAVLAASASLATEPEPQWLAEARAMVPEGFVAGRLYRFDEAGLTGAIAVFPDGADHPESPGSAFDPGLALSVRLESGPDGLVVAEADLAPRSPDDRLRGHFEDHYAARQAALASSREDGIEPCSIEGWALSDSSAGTAVRTAPDERAPIAGWLAPPHRNPRSEAASPDGYYADFEITGYKDGWFRIENGAPPGESYGDVAPDAPETYRGEGWLKVTEVGAAYANSQMPVPRLLAYPHIDAPDYAPLGHAASYDGSLSIDGNLMRLHACSGDWALTSSRDSQRGWWRGICSNQVTNCS